MLALHNQGVVAYVEGDLPTALAIFDRCEDEFAELGIDAAPLAVDRSAALLAAGLAAEAVKVVEEQLVRGAGASAPAGGAPSPAGEGLSGSW